MTASNVKPMDISKFINDNRTAGRMFNYWTEGGALAFGQKPDPVTGDIPLKLFMDGRAQAAYNHDTFLLWQTIYYGGPLMQKLRQQQKSQPGIIAKWPTGSTGSLPGMRFGWWCCRPSEVRKFLQDAAVFGQLENRVQ
jgi:hypothetical protein